MTSTPDPTLAKLLSKLREHILSAQNDTDYGSKFLEMRELYIEALVAAHTSGQLITLADHEAAVAKAVDAEREANTNAIKGSELLDGTSEPEDIAYTQGLYEVFAAILTRKGDAL